MKSLHVALILVLGIGLTLPRAASAKNSLDWLNEGHRLLEANEYDGAIGRSQYVLAIHGKRFEFIGIPAAFAAVDDFYDVEGVALVAARVMTIDEVVPAPVENIALIPKRQVEHHAIDSEGWRDDLQELCAKKKPPHGEKCVG